MPRALPRTARDQAVRIACRPRLHFEIVLRKLRPEYGKDYYATFFPDPDGLKLELVHFPWGYWRRAQTAGTDDRARYPRRLRRKSA